MQVFSYLCKILAFPFAVKGLPAFYVSVCVGDCQRLPKGPRHKMGTGPETRGAVDQGTCRALLYLSVCRGERETGPKESLISPSQMSALHASPKNLKG